jgi:hypothetical protein
VGVFAVSEREKDKVVFGMMVAEERDVDDNEFKQGGGNSFESSSGELKYMLIAASVELRQHI